MRVRTSFGSGAISTISKERRNLISAFRITRKILRLVAAFLPGKGEWKDGKRGLCGSCGHLQRHKTWWFGLYDHIRQKDSRQGGSDLGGVQQARIPGRERSSF